MQVNTRKGLEAGRSLHTKFGSWSNVRKAAKFENGVYVLKKDAAPASEPDSSEPESKPGTGEIYAGILTSPTLKSGLELGHACELVIAGCGSADIKVELSKSAEAATK